jgi:hypothetical protein
MLPSPLRGEGEGDPQEYMELMSGSGFDARRDRLDQAAAFHL